MLKVIRSTFSWIEKRQNAVLWGSIAAYVLFVSLLCFAKYARLGYNAIDLAYFNQVFWNTVRGRPFVQSIHPHLSLGDHAEFAILLLAPLYALFQDPRTLLVLQSVALALGAWPVFLLARDRFAHDKTISGRAAPLLFGLTWLANPFLQNINLFEFHLLPFALTPLLFALLAYRRENKKAFLLWTVLALLCREDVALVVMAIALLAWIEKKSQWWKITPFAIGAIWFIIAMKLIGHFAPGGSYKFTIYYAWLGNSLPRVVLGALAHPIVVAKHIVTLANVEMVVGFLMPYLFLPLLAPISLVLAIGPLAQTLLSVAGGGELIFDMHYATLFLPALILATIDGYAKLPTILTRISKMITPRESQIIAIVGVIFATIYTALVMGPIPASIARSIAPGDAMLQARAARTLLEKIPSDAPVATGYALMPLLSSRQSFYAAHYLFLGVTQFAEKKYPPPADLRYTLFDLNDLLTYQAQFPITFWTAPLHASGAGRLEAAAGEPIARIGTFVLYDRQAKTPIVAIDEPKNFVTPKLFGDFALQGASSSVIKKNVLRVTMRWEVPPNARVDDLILHIELKNRKEKTVRSTSATFNNLTPADVRRDGTHLLTIETPLNGLPASDYIPIINLERTELALVIDGDRSLRVATKKTESLGAVSLAPITASSQ